MPSTPTYCWSISINYYRLRSKTTLQVSKRLINKDFFYKINLIWLPITSTTISSRQSTDNERGQRWNANLIKSSPCSRSFFLSRGTVCWKAFLCSPRIQFIKQKKLQNVLADEEFHEHIRRWIVRTESFLQNPELASCARAARAAESWWRLEFLWRIFRFPLKRPPFIQLFGVSWSSAKDFRVVGKRPFRSPSAKSTKSPRQEIARGKRRTEHVQWTREFSF